MKPEKLYIYEFDGILKHEALRTDPSFLGCWYEDKRSYLFFTDDSFRKMNKFKRKFKKIKFISETVMNYDDWEPADSLKPFEVSSIKFIPEWNNVHNEDKAVIKINPGVVFGGGTHHTTKKCIEVMVDLFQANEIESVIDIGTGTGILSLASARLGAKRIVAVDNNNLSVETAKNNAKLNRLENVSCKHGDAKDFIENKADLVISNLIFSVIKNLFKPEINFQGKFYLVSGLFGTEAYHFRKSINCTSLNIVREEMDNFWSTFLLENQAAAI